MTQTLTNFNDLLRHSLTLPILERSLTDFVITTGSCPNGFLSLSLNGETILSLVILLSQSVKTVLALGRWHYIFM